MVNITDTENSYNRLLLRFITDITGFYYGHYGTFLKNLVDSGPRPPQNPHIWVNPGKKIGPIYFGYNGILRTLRKKLLRNITEYYGT
jgi:hypothetical protein